MVVQRFNILRKELFNKLTTHCWSQKKLLWGYVAVAFNRVDVDRLNLVGANRLCAEWVLKNGGTVYTIDTPNRPIKDYNSLPPENTKFKIKAIDGSGSSIMKIGLTHFKDCNHIDTLIFHQCKHLESDGLDGIVHLKDSLRILQVSDCDNISDEGLFVIEKMNHLQMLRIFNMRYVNDIEKVKAKISKALPNCHVDINK